MGDNVFAWVMLCVAAMHIGSLWLIGHVVSLALGGKGYGVQRRQEPVAMSRVRES